tara:strand:+ start:211 stop:462 length:252 start_codon:yes stop_codon:yes gene_type:complete
MAKNNKLNKERKKLKNGTLIYTLEIAVNPEEGTVEYIVEGLEEISDASGPINCLELPTIVDIEDYFDEEDIELIGDVYIVGNT